MKHLRWMYQCGYKPINKRKHNKRYVHSDYDFSFPAPSTFIIELFSAFMTKLGAAFNFLSTMFAISHFIISHFPLKYCKFQKPFESPFKIINASIKAAASPPMIFKTMIPRLSFALFC